MQCRTKGCYNCAKMIERDFDIPFVGRLALREKQIQQNEVIPQNWTVC